MDAATTALVPIHQAHINSGLYYTPIYMYLNTQTSELQVCVCDFFCVGELLLVRMLLLQVDCKVNCQIRTGWGRGGGEGGGSRVVED